MNWLLSILKYLGPVLLLLVVFYEYKLKHITPDARTTEHKKTSKTKFLILFLAGISGLVALGFDDWNKSQKDQAAKRERDGLNTQVTNLASQVTSQTSLINTINSNQLVLSQQNQTLLNELATNSSIDLNTRQRIVESNRKFEDVTFQVVDLNALETKLGNTRASVKIQHEKDLAAQQLIYEQNLPYCEYTVTTLTDLLGKVAPKGDKVVSDYQGLPSEIGPDIGETNMAEIKFQTHSDWDFKIAFGKREWNGRRPLRIYCKAGSLNIWASVASENLEADLFLSGEDMIPDSHPLAEYKKAIGDALGNLIAAEAEQSAAINR